MLRIFLVWRTRPLNEFHHLTSFDIEILYVRTLEKVGKLVNVRVSKATVQATKFGVAVVLSLGAPRVHMYFYLAPHVSTCA